MSYCIRLKHGEHSYSHISKMSHKVYSRQMIVRSLLPVFNHILAISLHVHLDKSYSLYLYTLKADSGGGLYESLYAEDRKATNKYLESNMVN